MKVVCIQCNNNRLHSYDYEPLVVGQIYDARDTYDPIFNGDVYVINRYYERKTDFMPLSEYRQKQLESIGI